MQSYITTGYNLGWTYLPLKGKRPLQKGWQKLPRPELAECLKYAEQGNVGIRTGQISAGLVVIDADIGCDLSKLDLPDTVTVRTGSGGLHLYYHTDKVLRNSVSKLGYKIDIRADGGQVVAAGSEHPDTGELYEYLLDKSPDDIAIAELPDWVINKLRPDKLPRSIDLYVSKALQDELYAVSNAKEGSRNHALNASAYALGQIVATGKLDEQDVTDQLINATTLPYQEAIATIRSGLDAGKLKPRRLPETPQTPQTTHTHERVEHVDKIIVPKEPLPLARAYIANNQDKHIKRWRGEYYKYNGVSYDTLSEDMVSAEMWEFLDKCYETEKKKITPRMALVREVSNALLGCSVLVNQYYNVPVWLNGKDKEDIIVCRNGQVNVSTGELTPNTPEYFNTTALPFDYDPDAPPPDEWLKFLDSLWYDQPDQQDLIQQIFGYLITSDTTFQKMFLLLGPKRSGKGTIARVLTTLLGSSNVAGPTLNSLSNQYGLQQLIGKSLAVISDARLSSRSDQGVITERLLSISGEDHLSAERKYLDSWEGIFPTRLFFISNEIPRLYDPSGALSSRFVILTTRHSFYGKEDRHLTKRLLGDLPGILNWAIEGKRKLEQDGVFIETESGTDVINELTDLSSPIGAFINNHCIVSPSLSVEVDDIYAAWKQYCEDEGRTHPGTKATFGRDLRSCIPDIRKTRPRVGGRAFCYTGIGLINHEN